MSKPHQNPGLLSNDIIGPEATPKLFHLSKENRARMNFFRAALFDQHKLHTTDNRIINTALEQYFQNPEVIKIIQKSKTADKLPVIE